MIKAIEMAVNSHMDNITIKSDSIYVINGGTKWIYRWVKNNWIKSNGSEVKDKSLWFKFLEFKKKIDVTLIHVKRNSGHGIIKADLLARSALNSSLSISSQDDNIQSTQSNCQNLDEISSNDLEINKSLIYASCVMCSDKEDNDVIECSIRHNWIHFQCTKLPAYQIQIFIDTNRKFICKNCANQLKFFNLKIT